MLQRFRLASVGMNRLSLWCIFSIGSLLSALLQGVCVQALGQSRINVLVACTLLFNKSHRSLIIVLFHISSRDIRCLELNIFCSFDP